MARATFPADSVGIQVPAGRIRAGRTRWQTVFDARDKPLVYRIHNAQPRDSADPGNVLIVEADGAKRPIRLEPGTSVDVLARKIRVKAGTGGSTALAEGWYVLVS